ncbi:hypothetical protein VTI28DRAFT_6488 [Corynascus sepedonium]
MKLLALLATTTALFLAPTLAVPVESTSTTKGDKSSQGFAAAARYGTPQCNSAMMNDLCISDNAGAYCDGTGFHNNFPKSCDGACFCA